MPKARPPIVIAIVTALVVAACSASTSAPSPSPTSVAPSVSGLPSQAAPSSTPPGAATPSGAPPSTPPATSQILVRGSARELSSNPVLMAPTRDGHLFVEVPARAPGSTVLSRFDSEGRSTPGWPVTLDGATYCEAPMPVDDGSVRMLCTLQNTTGGEDSGRAFAFDASGRALSGWPVEIDDPVVTGRLIGDALRVLATVAGDVEGSVTPRLWFLLSIDAAGTATSGGGSAMYSEGGELVAVGPDGTAYGVQSNYSSVDFEGRSSITPITFVGGGRGNGLEIDGVASGPAVDSDGKVVMLSAFPADRTSRVFRVDAAGVNVDAHSTALHFEAADPQSGETGSCESIIPIPPVIGRNGTIALYSEVDEKVFALDHSLETVDGWPFALPDSLVRPRPGAEFEHEAGYCPGPLAPSVGPDGTVYMALEAHKSSVGGSLVAVGPNGRVRVGWPVGLKRAGAEFWSIAVGADGTVYTIAYEPAAGGTSTATVLAIAPDSTIKYRTTIVAP